jgi:electron-transferring-flavoprotein dehydrogenase
MLSGIEAAEAAFEALGANRAHDELKSYETAVRDGAIGDDLKRVRNSKPMWSRFGTALGIPLGGIDMWLRTLLGGWSPLGTWGHGKSDAASIKPAADYEPIAYSKPDGVLTFDKLTSVAFSATNHEEDQPVHLKLTDPSIPIAVNLPTWAEPAQRYCPAGVYEVVRDDKGTPRFQINAQNCVHCKTCDIKDPSLNITWVCPEGGGGPNYAGM